MKTLFTLLVLLIASPAFAAPIYQASHVGSDAENRIFLQYQSADGTQNVNVFSNRFFTGRTHDVSAPFEGHFSLWVLDTQQRFSLDGPNVRQVGNTYFFDDGAPADSDFNDFVFTLTAYDSEGRLTTSPVPTPEPSTLILLASGLVGLVVYRWRR